MGRRSRRHLKRWFQSAEIPSGTVGGVLVGMWMTRDPVTAAPDIRLTEAALLMMRRRVRHLPVTRDGRLVGIISRHDVARAYPTDVNPFSAVADAPHIDGVVADG